MSAVRWTVMWEAHLRIEALSPHIIATNETDGRGLHGILEVYSASIRRNEIAPYLSTHLRAQEQRFHHLTNLKKCTAPAGTGRRRALGREA